MDVNDAVRTLSFYKSSLCFTAVAESPTVQTIGTPPCPTGSGGSPRDVVVEESGRCGEVTRLPSPRKDAWSKIGHAPPRRLQVQAEREIGRMEFPRTPCYGEGG